MNKLSLFFLISASLLIGILDFATTTYGLSIGLIEADGLYIPFLSTIVLFSIGLFADYIYKKTNFKDENFKIFFKYFAVSSISFLSITMVIPIINNVSLIL